MEQELLISFSPPLSFAGKSYDTLHLTEPTAGQLQRVKSSAASEELAPNMTFQMELVSAVSDLPIAVVAQMKVSDLAKASRFIVGFLNAPLPTSEI